MPRDSNEIKVGDYNYWIRCERCHHEVNPIKLPIIAGACCFCWKDTEQRVFWLRWWERELLIYANEVDKKTFKHQKRIRETLMRAEAVIKKHKNIRALLIMVGVLYDDKILSIAREHSRQWRNEIREIVRSVLYELRREDIERLGDGKTIR